MPCTDKKVSDYVSKNGGIMVLADGSCRYYGDGSSLGDGGWAVMVKIAEKYVLVSSGSKKNTQINEMEYYAIIEALKFLEQEMEGGRLSRDRKAVIRTDSMAVVKQLLGETKPKGPPYTELSKTASGLLCSLDGLVSINWVSRKRTRKVDAEAKRESGTLRSLGEKGGIRNESD